MTLILDTATGRAVLEALKERWEREPDSKLFMPLAEELRKKGCYTEAIELCVRGKALHPSYVSCRVLLGRCFMELGMKEEARRELEEVLELDRENIFSLQVMAETLRAQGKLTEAADYYRAVLRVNPADMDVQGRLAILVKLIDVSEKEAAESIDSFESVPSEWPGEPSIEGIELDASYLGREPEAAVKATHSPEEQPGEPESQPCRQPEQVPEQSDGSYEEREAVVAEEVSAAESDGSVLCKQETADQVVEPGPSPSATLKSRDSTKRSGEFFNYEIRHSDFSRFAEWVSKVRQEGSAAPRSDESPSDSGR